VEAACRQRYGTVVTRPLWMLQAFGTGADIMAHVTNTIFSDGDKDPVCSFFLRGEKKLQMQTSYVLLFTLFHCPSLFFNF
jgi:hypothetical protein